jgi:hypothetical protein
MSFYCKTSYSKAESSFYDTIYGNYKFDTDLTKFGMMLERKVRKVNRKGSVLKLRSSNDANSIYPMLDEFGYTFMDFFIFRSTWDQGYHFETVIPEPRETPKAIDFDLELDNTDRILKRFAKESFSIGRSYVQTRNQNTLDR